MLLQTSISISAAFFVEKISATIIITFIGAFNNWIRTENASTGASYIFVPARYSDLFEAFVHYSTRKEWFIRFPYLLSALFPPWDLIKGSNSWKFSITFNAKHKRPDYYTTPNVGLLPLLYILRLLLILKLNTDSPLTFESLLPQWWAFGSHPKMMLLILPISFNRPRTSWGGAFGSF